MTDHLTGGSGICRNCGAAAPQKFCPRCGQETSEHLPSAREFVHEFVLHSFAAEGRLWRTLRALILYPGRLTVEYLKGRKLAYVLPLRLYLTISVVFFVTLKLVVAPAAHAVNAEFHRILNDGHSDFSFIDAPHAHAVLHADGTLTCDLPAWLCERVKRRVSVPRAEFERQITDLPVEMFTRMSSAMFVLLPLFAGLLQVAFMKRMYGEHFLFALHIHSFWFLVLLAMLLPLPVWAQLPLQAYIVIYGVIALRVMYRATWLQTVLKAAFIGSFYVASLSLAIVLITFGALVV
jgi:Protein of unknown function (DUF3667)